MVIDAIIQESFTDLLYEGARWPSCANIFVEINVLTLTSKVIKFEIYF